MSSSRSTRSRPRKCGADSIRKACRRTTDSARQNNLGTAETSRLSPVQQGMKNRGILPALLLIAGTALRAADPAAATAPLEIDKPSPQVKAQLSAGAPQYAPPAPVELRPQAEPDPEVLILPKYSVKQRPRPRLGENVILGADAFNAKL